MDTLKKTLLSLTALLAFAACGSIKELKDADGIAYEEIDAPDAYCTEVSGQGLDIEAQFIDINTFESCMTNVTLDAACVFDAWENGEALDPIPDVMTAFDEWHADFVVSFDKPVSAGSVALFGSLLGESIGFPLPDMSANVPFRVLDTLASMIGYNDYVLYNMIYGVIQQFPCGALNMSSDNYGTTINVELRLFQVDEGEETGNYITVTNFVYTFRDPSVQPVSPTRNQTVTADDQSAAESAAALLPIEAANDDAAAAGQVDVLKRVVKSNGDGTYTVSVAIDEEKIVSPDETLAAAAEIGLAYFASVPEGTTLPLPLPTDKVTSGLYYSAAVATKLDFSDAVESPRVLATSEGVTLPITKPTGNTAFIKVKVNMVPTNE